MNKIFRRIFNAARGTIVAVDETKSSHSQSNSKCDTITGGYKPLVFAVISALSAAGVQAADINVDWESAKTDADIVVNKDGDSNANLSIQQITNQNLSWGNDQQKTAYIVGAPTGAGASAGLLVTGTGTATNVGTIYVDASSGYASGLAVGYGHEGKVVNNGTIYVRGSSTSFNPSKGKGISIDDGYGVNAGTIVVLDNAYGMVSNSQGSATRNRIENTGTISGSGLMSAGMVVNKGGNQVQVRNDGTIDMSEAGALSSGILVASDADAAPGQIYITNAGRVTASESGDAIKISAASTNVQLVFTGDSEVSGDVAIASKNGVNNTSLIVETDQNLSLDASYLKSLSVANSTLTLSNKKDELTIDGMSLTNGSFVVADSEDPLTILINDLTKDANSSVNYGNAKVQIQDDTYAVSGTENFGDLIIGTETHSVDFSTNEGATANVQNDFHLVNGSYSNGVNAALNVQGNAEVAEGTVLNNNQSDAVVSVQGTVSIDGTVNNAGHVWAGEGMTVGTGTFNNRGAAQIDSDLTLGDSGVVENYGDLTLAGNLIKQNETGIFNNRGTLKLTGESAEIGADVTNLGEVVVNSSNVTISSTFQNEGWLTAGDSTVTVTNKTTNSNGFIAGTLVVDEGGVFTNLKGSNGATNQAVIGNTLAIWNGSVVNQDYMTTGVLTGTGRMENQASFYATDIVANNGFSFVNGSDAATEVSGSAAFYDLTNNGSITVAGAMSVFGENAVNNGTLTVGSLSTEGTSTLVNFGSVTVNSALDGVNYTQSGANAEISFANDEVTNSTITIADGAAWAHQLGTGNTYIVESNQKLNVENGGHLDPDWASDFSQIVADAVTSENTFVINEGGVLKFNTLGMGGREGEYITVDGGALQTSLDQIFDGVAYDDGFGHRIEDGEALASVGANTVSGLSSNAQTAIAFGENGGYIVFDDAHYFDTITNAIDDAFLDGNWNHVTIAFTGQNEASGDFDLTWANEKLAGIDSDVNYVFGDIELDASSTPTVSGAFSRDENGNVTMDGRVDAGSSSIGFSNISGTDAVNVINGAHLTLVQGTGENHSLIGTDGGSVAVDNAVLTLSNGEGWLNLADVSNGGVFEVYGGKYKVDEATIHNQGRLDVQAGTLNIGTLVSAGEIENAGTLGAESITLTGGNLTNDGMAHADRLTVEAGGSLINNAQANWGAAVISGAAENGGTEYVSDYQLLAGGTQKNYGQQHVGTALIGGSYENIVAPDNAAQSGYLQVDGVLTVDQNGLLHNEGRVDIADTLVVNGSVTNAGEMLATNLVSSTGGIFANEADAVLNVLENADFDSLVNDGAVSVKGTMKGADIRNTAEAVLEAGSLVDSGKVSNAGTLKVLGDAGVGSLTNAPDGLVYVAGGLTAETVSNDGTLWATSIDADQFTNTSYAEAETLTATDLLNTDTLLTGSLTAESVTNTKTLFAVDEANVEKLINMADAEFTAGKLVLSGESTNAGSVTVLNGAELNGTYEQTGEKAVFAAGADSVVSGSVNVAGGTFTLGQNTSVTGSVTATNGSNVLLGDLKDGKLEGALIVDHATMTVGTLTEGVDTMSNHPVADDRYTSTFIAAQKPINLGEVGSVAVGSDAAAHSEAGNVWFGADSLLRLNTAALGSEGLFVGAEGGSFMVEDGAQIQLDSVGWGQYNLVSKDFGTAEAGGWLEHGNVIYTGDEDIDVSVTYDKDGNVLLVVGSNDILDKLPDVAVPNLVNEVIADPDRSPNAAGVKGFLAGAIEDSLLSKDLQAETINDTAQIMAAGGVLVQGMTLVGNVMDITDRHLSYEDVHFKNGQLQRFDGVRLWADALGQRVDASGYDFSGSSAEFDGYNTGFIFGADLMASCDARYGAAFAYQNANIDSNGSAVKTSNEADAYTFALYAAKTWGNFNFIGSLAYTRIDSDLEQSLPGALGAKQGKHTMDVSNDIYTLGLKGEYNVSLSKHTQMVPYVGVRAVWMDTSDEKSKLGGSDAFDYDTDSITQVQFPIGVAFQGMTETKSGWTGRGVIDLSVTPVAGDKDVDTTIGANGLTAQDVVNTEFADDLTGAIRIGISAEKDNMAFGGNLGFSTGGSRDGNVTFGLNARYRF